MGKYQPEDCNRDKQLSPAPARFNASPLTSSLNRMLTPYSTQGYRAGPLHHWRYFKLLGLTKKERNAFIKRRKLRYTWFGTIALLLQLIPVLSMFFLLTTAVGSALWVVRLEKAKRHQEGQVEGYQDDPPPYEDVPA